MLVGEQPGNDEDLQGHPFVGPAGQLLDRVLDDAGIARDEVYVTNAVKHFSWEERNNRRLHKTPTAAEVSACQPWLLAEIAAVKPQVLVALGATAAKGIFGAAFRVTRQRGQDITTPYAPHSLATIHPSAVLRQRTSADRARELKAMTHDLTVAARLAR